MLLWLMQVHATPSRVVEGRFEFGGVTFVLGAGLLLGLTFAGLLAARHYRESRDARLSESSGGWRLRAHLDLDPGDPFSRFDGLGLMAPHNVMEGTEDGFPVAYFEVTVGRETRIVRPCALVQVPVDPPRPYAVDAEGPVDPTLLAGWGPRAAAVLSSAYGVRIRTAPLAILVQSTRAPSDTVSRVALALAHALVADDAARRAETPGRPV